MQNGDDGSAAAGPEEPWDEEFPPDYEGEEGDLPVAAGTPPDEASAAAVAAGKDFLALDIAAVAPLLMELGPHEMQGYAQVVMTGKSGELICGCCVRRDVAGEVMLVALPAGLLDEKGQPRSPSGDSPQSQGVKMRGGGTCSVLFVCMGDEVFAGGRVVAWESFTDAERRPCLGFCRHRIGWPDGSALHKVAQRLGYGQSNEAWFSAADAPLAPAPLLRSSSQLRAPGAGAGSEATNARLAALETQLGSLVKALKKQQRSRRKLERATRS